MKSEKTLNARVIAFVGMLGAVSMVLMLFNFAVPFAPSFLKFDIAELPALFAGFFLGPLSGFLVVLIKIILKLLIQGTETAFVGEATNLVCSTIYVLVAAFIYKLNKTKKGAIIALTAATLVVSIIFIFANAYVTFPLYSRLYGMPMSAIIGMGSAVNPLITDTMTLMIFAVLPFNLLKHGVTSIVTYLIYKKCSKALKSLLNVEDQVFTKQRKTA